MYFGNQFYVYHPQLEQITRTSYPFLPYPELIGIASRARAVLSNRSFEEINGAAILIDVVLDEIIEKSDAVKYFEHYRLDNVGSIRRTDIGETQLFRYGYQHYDLWGYEGFPNLEIHEYFAVLALWRIADALNSIRSATSIMRPGNPDSSEMPMATKLKYEMAVYLQLAGRAAIDATEAIEFTEHLQNIQTINLDIGRRVTEEATVLTKRLNAQRVAGGLKKNAHNRQVRALAVQLFDKTRATHPKISIHKIAIEILPQVISYAKEIKADCLYSERAEKTVYDWLRDHHNVKLNKS